MAHGTSGTDSGHREHRAAFAEFAERMRAADHAGALAAARAAHDEVLAAGHLDLLGVALNCVGLAQHELGEFTDAVQAHQRALRMSWRHDVRAFAGLRASLSRIAAGEDAGLPHLWDRDLPGHDLAALARSEHPHFSLAAQLELGRLAAAEGHRVTAVDAYRAVVDSGHPWFRLSAAAALADLLRRYGDDEGADRLAVPADTAAGAPDPVELALLPLADPDAPAVWLAPVRPGLASYRAGDVDAARAQLRAAAAGDWRHAAHQAAVLLAGIELRHGEHTPARELLAETAATDDFTHGPRAAVALAVLDTVAVTDAGGTGADAVVDALASYLIRDQDARADLETLAHSQNPLADVFAALLGDLLRDGEPDAPANELLERASESENGLAAGYAAYLIATDPANWDKTERAADALERAHNQASPVLAWAAIRLGEATNADLYRSGDAQWVFQSALDANHRALLPRAAAGLLASSPADGDMAEERYELAAEWLTADLPAEAVGPLAWLVAENLITYQDELAEGARVLARIPESDPRFGVAALAVRALVDGDVDTMRRAFDRLGRWDKESLHEASTRCMSAVSRLDADSPTTRPALMVLADLGFREASLTHQVLDQLARVCEHQGDLEGELAAREKIRFRLDGHWGGGVLEIARRCYLGGDLDQAVELYRRALADFPRVREQAAVDLAVLLLGRGEVDAAQDLLPSTVDPKHCCELGSDLKRSGRLAEAVLAWELVADTSDRVHSARANYYLGETHAELGDTAAAIAAYQRAGRVADPFAVHALYALGKLHEDRGELPAARENFQRGIEVGTRLDNDGFVVGLCRLHLANVANLSGDHAEARRRYRELVEDPDRGTAAMAAMMLGADAKDRVRQLTRQGERLDSAAVAEARHWYQWVLDSGDRFQRDLALAHLGELHYWVGDRDQTREFYQRVLDSTSANPEYVAEAAYRLGELASQDGDTERAVAHLERAVRTGDATFAGRASDLLTRLRG